MKLVREASDASAMSTMRRLLESAEANKNDQDD